MSIYFSACCALQREQKTIEVTIELVLYQSFRNNITDSIHLHVSARDSQLSYTHKVTPGPVDQHHYGL